MGTVLFPWVFFKQVNSYSCFLVNKTILHVSSVFLFDV